MVPAHHIPKHNKVWFECCKFKLWHHHPGNPAQQLTQASPQIIRPSFCTLHDESTFPIGFRQAVLFVDTDWVLFPVCFLVLCACGRRRSHSPNGVQPHGSSRSRSSCGQRCENFIFSTSYTPPILRKWALTPHVHFHHPSDLDICKISCSWKVIESGISCDFFCRLKSFSLSWVSRHQQPWADGRPVWNGQSRLNCQ